MLIPEWTLKEPFYISQAATSKQPIQNREQEWKYNVNKITCNKEKNLYCVFEMYQRQGVFELSMCKM